MARCSLPQRAQGSLSCSSLVLIFVVLCFFPSCSSQEAFVAEVRTGRELVTILRSRPPGPANITIEIASGNRVLNLTEAPRAPPLSFFNSGSLRIVGGPRSPNSLDVPIIDFGFLSEGTVSSFMGPEGAWDQTLMLTHACPCPLQPIAAPLQWLSASLPGKPGCCGPVPPVRTSGCLGT